MNAILVFFVRAGAEIQEYGERTAGDNAVETTFEVECRGERF